MHPARLQALIVESVVAAVVVIVISVCAMASSSQHCRHQVEADEGNGGGRDDGGSMGTLNINKRYGLR